MPLADQKLLSEVKPGEIELHIFVDPNKPEDIQFLQKGDPETIVHSIAVIMTQNENFKAIIKASDEIYEANKAAKIKNQENKG